jgi:hypothetical protein
MRTMKNEHLVWAYGVLDDGSGCILLVGLTLTGLAYLKHNFGKSLVVDPPKTGFPNIRKVIVYAEQNKAALKETLRQAGVTVVESE